MNLNFPTGVCIFCGQSPSESTTAQSPLGTLATSVTQATRSPQSPAPARFTPIEWKLFGNEERKLPPCVILPPTASSLAVAAAGRAAAALGQLNGMPPASQFSCPNALLSYGYNLFTKEPKEETNFLTMLKKAIDVPNDIHENDIHELIRSYVYSSFKHSKSIQEWCDYLKVDDETKAKLITALDPNAQREHNPAEEGIETALEKIYIKITRIRDSLPEKSLAERTVLEAALKRNMEDIIYLLIDDQNKFLEKIGMTLCEIEKLAELDRNPENCFFEPFASWLLFGYAISLMLGGVRGVNARGVDTNTIFAKLGIETNPDFLVRFQCSLTAEEFRENYDPVHFFITNPGRSATLLRKAVLEWAIKHYNLNQYKIVNGQREYDALTQALCENPEALETQGGIQGIQIRLKPKAILFLLEAVGIIRRTTGEKK